MFRYRSFSSVNFGLSLYALGFTAGLFATLLALGWLIARYDVVGVAVKAGVRRAHDAAATLLPPWPEIRPASAPGTWRSGPYLP